MEVIKPIGGAHGILHNSWKFAGPSMDWKLPTTWLHVIRTWVAVTFSGDALSIFRFQDEPQSPVRYF